MHKVLEMREQNLRNGLAEIYRAKDWLADFKGSQEFEKETFYPVESEAILNRLAQDIDVRLRLYASARKDSVEDGDFMGWLKLLAAVVTACDEKIAQDAAARDSLLMVYRDEARQAFELIKKGEGVAPLSLSVETLLDGSERVSISEKGLFSKDA